VAVVTYPYDHSRDPLNTAQLADQIASSLGLATVPSVEVSPTEIIVARPGLTETHRPQVQAVIDAYVYDEAWSGGIEGVLRAKAAQALQANATYLALASPTNAQTLAQVQRLTREASALIRLVTDNLDSTSGT
jgi:hypothetical protein